MSELGQALREAREEKGMTLDDIQDLTKIQKRYLMAIESGEFSKLPGNFYTRAFMKSYAEAVGIDPKELFAEHSKELPRLESEVEVTPVRARTRTVKSRDSKFINALPKIAIIAVLLVILIGIWFFMQKMTSGESGKADTPNKGVVIKNGTNLGNWTAHGKESDKTKSSDGKSNDQTDQFSDTGTSDNQQIKLENTSGQVSHFTVTGTDQFVVEVSAKPGSSSWITASKNNSKGKRLYFDFVSNGVKGHNDAKFQQDLSSLDTIYLKVGSAPNTIITVNGQAIKIPDVGTTQQIYITNKKSGT